MTQNEEMVEVVIGGETPAVEEPLYAGDEFNVFVADWVE